MNTGLVVAVLLLGQSPDEAAATVARLSVAEIAAGQRLFAVHCANCHGIDGRGGRGPGLARPMLRRVADDKALFDAIGDGLPGTEMPPVWYLSDAERWRVVGYVRSLGRVGPETAPGDPAQGRVLYVARGCAACHVVAGDGGIQGPELTDVGARRSPAYLREALLEPAATAPEGFLFVRARVRGGREVEGLRLNEDTFNVQIRDLQDRLHSFRKDALDALIREPERSTMPSYRGQLTDAELDDLVAYMAGLRRQP
jgi:cytochrome c oxidase cbb3-type subunit III